MASNTTTEIKRCGHCKGCFVNEKMRDSHEKDCKWSKEDGKRPRVHPTSKDA